ncbi:MAG TPA: hypothetical protein VIX37_14835 [Candidatus Sulfotelmatobacter sp.]
MGDAFGKVAEWVKTHKGLAIAVSGGVLILVYLWRSSQNASAAAAATQVSGAPSDAVMTADIQAQAALQQEQIAAQAQGTQEGYQAQVDLAYIQAQQGASNQQNQAALTLGLAQAGNSTQSILELIGAQPGTVPSSSTVGNSTTSPAAAATLTGAAPGAGTGTNQQVNPNPVTPLPQPSTPVSVALARDPSQAASTGTMSYYDLLAEVGLQNCQPTDISCVANNASKQQDVETFWAANEVAGVPEGTVITVNPLTSSQVTGPSGYYDPTYQGGNTLPSNNYTVTMPSAAAGGAVVSSSTVPASGGPPGGDLFHPVLTAGIINSVHNASPTMRTSILSSYGIQDTAAAETGISHMLGTNEPVTATGVS